MNSENSEVLEFIKSCIRHRRIYWTYHVNMRLKERFISREAILASVDTYEVIEKYPQDKYLSSYLIYAEDKGGAIHIQIAIDRENENIRIVTVYRPTIDRWEREFKVRRDYELS
ncbi:MAG: DUF4258 domain-containing protein [Candidatus Omnitrophica bacterium]|nr:DUF4258 domain-containing protein [Candidatus Omnitrophota bacterium]MBU1523168.1 DUF4258 domain-containing protein [Candidatus Omnitrophota bacterium]MBU2437451.1 DUF4258 domain-containing protein [Candidatus Omnitrophota bacterium]